MAIVTKMAGAFSNTFMAKIIASSRPIPKQGNLVISTNLKM